MGVCLLMGCFFTTLVLGGLFLIGFDALFVLLEGEYFRGRWFSGVCLFIISGV